MKQFILLFLCALLARSGAAPAGAFLIVDMNSTFYSLAILFAQTFDISYTYNGTLNGLSLELNWQREHEKYFDYNQQDNYVVIYNPGNYQANVDYKACKDQTCEQGTVVVTANSTNLYFQINVNSSFEGELYYGSNPVAQIPNPSVIATCRNHNKCQIPPTEVSQAILDNFDMLALGQLEHAVDLKWGTPKMIPPTYNILQVTGLNNSISPILVGDWQIFPWGQEPGAIIPFPYAGFGYMNGKDEMELPPFEPTFSLPSGFASGIKASLNFILSEYFFSSYAWTLWKTGLLKTTITNNNYYNVSVKDFVAAAPWLKNYLTYEMEVMIEINDIPQATIDSSGVHFSGANVGATFLIGQNLHNMFTGWEINATMHLDLWLSMIDQDGYTWDMSYMNTSVYFSNFQVKSSKGAVDSSLMQDYWSSFTNKILKYGNQNGDVLWGFLQDNYYISKAKVVFYNGFANLEAWIPWEYLID